MSDISISHKHKLPHKKAVAAAQKMVDQLTEEYGVSSEWEGDTLIFKHSGVSGSLALMPDEAQLDITLGFMLKVFSAKIEERIHKNMAEVFHG